MRRARLALSRPRTGARSVRRRVFERLLAGSAAVAVSVAALGGVVSLIERTVVTGEPHLGGRSFDEWVARLEEWNASAPTPPDSVLAALVAIARLSPNVADPASRRRAIPAAAARIGDRDDWVRTRAVTTLIALAGHTHDARDEARAAAAATLRSSADSAVRTSALQLLGALGAPSDDIGAIAELARRDRSPTVRALGATVALRAVSRRDSGAPLARRIFLTALDDVSAAVRTAAIDALLAGTAGDAHVLLRSPDSTIVSRVRAAQEDEDRAVREAAGFALEILARVGPADVRQ